MSTIKAKEIEAALLRKGFKKSEGDHHWFTYFSNGKKTSVRTKISHDGRDYADYLLGQMSKQLKLSKSQLLDLIKCPMSADQYLQHLLDNQHVRVRVDAESN